MRDPLLRHHLQRRRRREGCAVGDADAGDARKCSSAWSRCARSTGSRRWVLSPGCYVLEGLIKRGAQDPRAARQRRHPRRRARLAQALQGRRPRSQGGIRVRSCDEKLQRHREGRPARGLRSHRSFANAVTTRSPVVALARTSPGSGKGCTKAAVERRREKRTPRAAPPARRRGNPARPRRDPLRTEVEGSARRHGHGHDGRRRRRHGTPKAFLTHLAGKRARGRGDPRRLMRTRASCAARSSRRLTLYSVPELRFAYDDSIESGMHLSQLIDAVVAADRNLDGADAADRDTTRQRASRAAASTACSCSTSRWGSRRTPRCRSRSACIAPRRQGHTGTLDPFATGLLPICFGEATKFAQALLDERKAYVADRSLRRGDVAPGMWKGISREGAPSAFTRDRPRRGVEGVSGADRATAADALGAEATRAGPTTSMRARVSRPACARDVRPSTRSCSSTGRRRGAALRIACGKGTYFAARRGPRFGDGLRARTLRGCGARPAAGSALARRGDAPTSSPTWPPQAPRRVAAARCDAVADRAARRRRTDGAGTRTAAEAGRLRSEAQGTVPLLRSVGRFVG